VQVVAEPEQAAQIELQLRAQLLGIEWSSAILNVPSTQLMQALLKKYLSLEQVRQLVAELVHL
jgi:hypothetical protein